MNLISTSLVVIALFQVAAGMETTVQLASFALAVLGALISAFSKDAVSMKVTSSVFSIEVIRQSQAVLGVGTVTSDAKTCRGVRSATAVLSRRRIDSDDPNRGTFGGSHDAAGLSLWAEIVVHPENKRLAVVRLVGRYWAKGGDISFHLHPSFKTPVVEVPQVEGEASLVLVTSGSFTAGATTRDGRAVELDLSTVKGAPRSFYRKRAR